MTSEALKHAEAVFGDPTVIRCERGIAEMRAGRPVVVTGAGGAVAALALDGCTRQDYAAFARAFDGAHKLYLSSYRAAAVGLAAPDGALLPLRDVGFDEASRLGYGRGRFVSLDWTPAHPLAAAAARIARLGLLLPAVIIAELPAEARPEGLLEVSEQDLLSGAEAAGRSFEIVARTRVPLREVDEAEFVVFRGGLAQRDQIAIVVGAPDPSQSVPVRVHSACLTGDLFGSLKCDCGDQLRRSLQVLVERGGGVLLYLDQEGRGTGIAAKMRAYGYQHEGLDTIDADAQLGFGHDERRYDAAIAMLDRLGFAKIELLTNNPQKLASLRSSGMQVVGRIALTGEVTMENETYLRTKAARSGHLLDVDALIRGAANAPGPRRG